MKRIFTYHETYTSNGLRYNFESLPVFNRYGKKVAEIEDSLL